MSVATPEVTVTGEVLVTPWSVEVTVYVQLVGETRLAQAGECEVVLQDVGEGVDWTVYNQTPYLLTNNTGKSIFLNSQYSWIEGFDPDIWNGYSSNRFLIYARVAGQSATEVPLILFLSSAEWSVQQP